ncbi:ABC transporter family substrate-binding protein [Nonomuraea lactucae]|uniref:ABC transporter family substrate-binding protein n=1 Tax=Nonomuraea lactucae TaxID=2249762 RepID=UPI0013B39DAB|nr:ABC transporter family substrate-binding protein [Nonomuraea lactucae]
MRSLLATGVVLAVLVTGCSSGSGPGAPAQRAATPEIGVHDVNPVPRDRVADGGTLRWPIGTLPEQWNFKHVNGGLADQLVVMDALLPRAFASDEKGNVTPDPDYVLDAGIQPGEKPVVTLKLNPKAKWSDGEPVTAADYIGMWKAMNGRDDGYQTGGPDPYDQMEKVDRGANEHEVVVTFAKPYADWKKMFAQLMPASVTRTAEGFNKGYLGRMGPTAGPFKLGEINKTAGTVTIVRDPGWWGAPAKLDKIIFRGMEADAQVNAFANNELDLVSVGGSANYYARAKEVPGVTLRRALSTDTRFLMLNGSSATLSDVRVRQAVLVGINREVFAQASLKGLDWPIRTLDNHFFGYGQEGYQDNTGGLGKYDPAKAAKLLDEAGWTLPAGKQVRERNGLPLKIRFHIISGQERHKLAAELAQSLLKEIGITIEIIPTPAAEFFDKYVRPGNFDIVTFGVGGGTFPVSDNVGAYLQPTKDEKGEVLTRGNEGRIGSPELDEALRRATAELDPARARQLANEADAKIWELVTRIMLFQGPEIIATKSNLANYGATAFADLRYEDIGFTK